jgi:hypothetical protein
MQNLSINGNLHHGADQGQLLLLLSIGFSSCFKCSFSPMLEHLLIKTAGMFCAGKTKPMLV